MSKSKGRKLAEWLRTLNANQRTETDGIADTSITFAKLHTALVVTESEGIGNNDNDTTIATNAAIVDYVANNTLRIDTAAQGLTGTQQTNALTNLGITSTVAELNILDGVTATTAEINYIDGVTSNIQTQLNAKLESGSTASTLTITSADINGGNIDATTIGGTTAAAGTFSSLTSTGGATLSGSSTETVPLEIGAGRSGDGISHIDLVGDATYSDYGARWIRNAGANADTYLYHRGTGDLGIAAIEAGAIAFDTSNTERMRIDSSGRVGIGTTTPQNLFVVSDSNQGLEVNPNATNEVRLSAYDRTNALFRPLVANCDSFYVRIGGVDRMYLASNGDLHADGNVIAYSTTISDERLKDDVETIDSALDKVSNLRGVTYTWNKGSREGKRDLGVIAQEVEAVIPEIVHEHEMPLLDGETYKTVDYEKLCAVLIEAVKELKAEVDALKGV